MWADLKIPVAPAKRKYIDTATMTDAKPPRKTTTKKRKPVIDDDDVE